MQSSSYCCSHQKKRRDRILYLCLILSGSFGRWMPGSTTWGESAHSSSSLSCNPPFGILLGRLDNKFLETIYEDDEVKWIYLAMTQQYLKIK